MSNPRRMPLLVAVLTLGRLGAFGQEAEPFEPERRPWWQPSWEVVLRGDRLEDPGTPSEAFRRVQSQLRLRWAWEREDLRLTAGLRAAMGSDGNRFNAPRWDQQPSNGTQVDVFHGSYGWVSARSFGTLTLGFQENGLVTSQALWDRNLRLLGAGGRLGFRSTDGLVQEAGLRAVAGRVRNVLGGRGDLAAAQAVLEADTGPWSWGAHAGRWRLAWDPGAERLRRVPGHDPLARQEMTVDAGGLSATWHSRFPLEARWFQSRNTETGETSEEVQLIAGGRERLYWPQLSFTWQRLSSTGTLYPVNGDEWWFYRNAKGPRLDLAVPLPGQWVAALAHMRQTFGSESYRVTRTLLVLTKRF